MELVSEEKPVVITTEKPIVSPSNENVKETLFPVDFDVDSSQSGSLIPYFSFSIRFPMI